MVIVMDEFKVWHGVLNMQGAIDCMHISIVKPSSFPKYYYYHKLRGYTIMAQLIVGC
jgi:hypothetical protein